MAEKKEWQRLSEVCTQVMGEIETHLSKRAKYETTLQMRKNLKVRKERFGDPDKKMLQLVINSQSDGRKKVNTSQLQTNDAGC